MKNLNYRFFSQTPRQILLTIAVVCGLLLTFGILLQEIIGLKPCPMCIMQRYAFIGMGLSAVLGALLTHKWWLGLWSVIGLIFSGFGSFVAARQSWLQWNPPEFATCGRDFYSIVETFPLSRSIPMLFSASGDCTNVDWTFLGLSIANWSFVWLVIFSLVLAGLFVSLFRQSH